MVRGAPGRVRRSDGESLRARRGARRIVIAQLPKDWPNHIGRRVTMRWSNHDDGDTHSELYGVLQSVFESDGGQVLKVLDKRGQTHTVPVEDIVAARVRRRPGSGLPIPPF